MELDLQSLFGLHVYSWARICERLGSPGIDSGTSNRGIVPTRQAGNRFLDSLKGLQIRALFSLAVTPPNATSPPHLGSYTRALLVSQDRRHLFVTPCTAPIREINVPPNACFLVHILDSGISLPNKCRSGESVRSPPLFFTLYFCPLSTLLDTPTTLYLHRLMTRSACPPGLAGSRL